MNKKDFFDFILLQDANVQFVVISTMFIGATAAIVGCFLFLRKQALVGDAIAHSVLPGVCIAFALFQNKHSLILLSGAVVTGWLSLIFIQWVTSHSKIKSDTAIGLTLSWFFAIGILMLTAIQKTGNASQSGLDKFLFGKASSMVQSDITLFSTVCILLLISVIFFYRPLKLISFDRNFAIAKGLPVHIYDLLLNTITVIAVATGIQAVGVVLMAALLITPAAAARFWTNKLSTMLFIAGIFGAVSGYLGSFISYFLPKMPTGPWIVLTISFIAICSFLVGSKKGLVLKKIKQNRIATKIVSENILKALYHLGEDTKDFQQSYSVPELMNKRFFVLKDLKKGLSKLKQKGLIEETNKTILLTEPGIKEGQRITRLHRLWEMYLNQYLKIAPDHVHDDAEAIEHIITPEIEAELLSIMNRPEFDPHDEKIPYSQLKNNA